MRRIPGLLALAVVATAVGARPAPADIVDRLDRPAPDVACAKWWNGAPPKMKRLRGRVVVVHVSDPEQFTSKAFEGKVKELAAKNADRPFTLVEVVLGETEADVASYVARSGATWHVGWDAEHSAASALPGSSVPRTYLVGPDGVVAFHAHIQALTPEILEAQYARVAFFDTKNLPRKAKAAAKAAGELRFGRALEEAEKLLADKHATDEDRAIAETIKAEIPRYHAFQTKIADGLWKERDLGVLYARILRMQEIYRGTPQAASVDEYRKRLDANPRVAYVVEAQRLLDRMIEKPQRKKNDVEALVRELSSFANQYEGTAPGDKAQRWIEALKRRLRDGDVK